MRTTPEDTQRFPQDDEGERSDAQIEKEPRVKPRWTLAILVCLAVAILGVVFFIMRPNASNAPGSANGIEQLPGRATSVRAPGSELRLYIPAQSSIMLAADEKALDDLMNALSTRSGEVQNLIQSNRVFTVPNQTSVRIIELRSGKMKVRVLEGDKIMSEGWVPERWVQ
jgi:DNA-binding XRE family transcriptional regulator